MYKIIISSLIALFFGKIVVDFNLYALLALLVFFVALSIFVAPKYFILFWLIFAAISNKIVVPTINITSYGLMNIIFLPSLILKILIDYKKDFFKFPVIKPYLLFLLVIFISIWYSSVPYIEGIRKYCNFVIPLLFSILMVNVLKDRKTLNRYLHVTLFSVVILGIVGTIMFYLRKWIVFLDIPRAIGVLGWPNDYALFLNITLAITFSFALWEDKTNKKILYYFLSIIIIFSIIPTFSKGGYIASSIVILGATTLSSIKRKSVKPILTSFGIFIFIGFFLLLKYSDIITYRLHNMSSFNTRVEIWKSVLPKFLEHPFIGNGFRSSLSMVSSLSPYKNLTSTHNLYLRILLETGIIGLIVFIIAYGAMCVYAFKILFYSKNKFLFSLSVGFISSFVAALIYCLAGNSFLTPMINLYIWFYFSFLICFHQLERKDELCNR